TRSLAGAPTPAATGSGLDSPAKRLDDAVLNESAPTYRFCGTVQDANARPLSGVVLSIAQTGASTTTGATGAFCLDATAPHPTLEAYVVGFRPYRAALSAADAAAPMVIAMTPVETLTGARSWSSSKLGFRSEPEAEHARVQVTRQMARAATADANRK